MDSKEPTQTTLTTETTQEVTISYIVNQENWWQAIAQNTPELMDDDDDPDSEKLDQVLTDIDRAEQANLKVITAIRSGRPSANLKWPDTPARRSREG